MAEVILCANQRLARHLRAEHDRTQVAAGRATWQPLAALTIGAWLEGLVAEGLLAGAIGVAQAPRLALTAAQESLLWEQAIAATLADGEDALFDREGLAAAAAEAEALCQVWNLRPSADAGEETRRFLDWRRHVRSACEPRGWFEAARLRAWQIACIADGAGRLPASVAFAGFDRYSPQEAELKRVLAARGVAVSELALGRASAGEASVAACADRRAECHAAAAWTSARLAEQPNARMGVVVPDLGSVREMLVAALDDALHPEALLAANAEQARRYNVSLGTPVAREPIVAVALELLQLAANPRRCEQARLGALLRGPYWSAWQSEADGRAGLEAAMRRHLPPVIGVPPWLTFLKRFEKKGLRIARTRAHVEALVKAVDGNSGKRLPSAWGGWFAEFLEECGWPGERTLSSREWQARDAFRETLDQFGALDALLGKVALPEAARRLLRLARERVFQPETVGRPSVEVMGPLEAAGLAFDALWVLGMNDDVWPPSPRPNPLLPADIQRRAKSSNASAEVQLEFARSVQQRLMHAAPEIVFSWAQGEGDRQLRPSPLLAGLPAGEVPLAIRSVVAVQVGGSRIEALADHRAPPLAEGERVAGGANLLKAQALCPAWAYYRYRLGARPLDEPAEGLDAMDRGTLLHRVMEKFFSGRTQAELAALGDAQRDAAIRAAVGEAFAAFDAEREEPLAPRFATLERTRLEHLLGQWLRLELARPVPFAVVACEQKAAVDIEGIAIDLKVDRIDELADGRRLILDYKTGDPKVKDWDGERIAEPQLPLYATHVEGHPAAVSFAKVRADDCAFVGLGAEAGLVDGIKAAPDWLAMLEQWHAAIAAVAREIRAGHAAVSFAREDDLKYCEVLPLLRLPEAKAQRDRS
ncbi:MAG: PD-(D/E)XK nuclease family protein [Rhodocyclales bacterium]|nr:PD-(D/E)XK nuclease family protein [Rhodocyclales bacterium]